MVDPDHFVQNCIFKLKNQSKVAFNNIYCIIKIRIIRFIINAHLLRKYIM